jgi:hypothetical protein
LRLKAGQVEDLKAGDTVEIKEKKTGKARRITLNKTCIKAILHLLSSKHIMMMITYSRVSEGMF